MFESNLALPVSGWLAVHCKPRSEAVAQVHLERQGFECFLPRIRTEVRASEGWRTRIEAFFPRYLFIRADKNAEHVASVRSTRGVTGLVRFGDRIAALSERDVAQLRSYVCAASGFVEMRPASFAKGDRVRVRVGPLAGLTGVVHEPSGGKRIAVLIEVLGRSAEIQLQALSLSFA